MLEEPDTVIGSRPDPLDDLHVMSTPGNGRWVYAVDDEQVRRLVRHLFVQLESMGMPSAQQKAAKSVFARLAYTWWESVKDNSVTAAPGSGWRPRRVIEEVTSIPSRRPVYRWFLDNEGQIVTLAKARRALGFDRKVGSVTSEIFARFFVNGGDAASASSDDGIAWRAFAQLARDAGPHFEVEDEDRPPSD